MRLCVCARVCVCLKTFGSCKGLFDKVAHGLTPWHENFRTDFNTEFHDIYHGKLPYLQLNSSAAIAHSCFEAQLSGAELSLRQKLITFHNEIKLRSRFAWATRLTATTARRRTKILITFNELHVRERYRRERERDDYEQGKSCLSYSHPDMSSAHFPD